MANCCEVPGQQQNLFSSPSKLPDIVMSDVFCEVLLEEQYHVNNNNNIYFNIYNNINRMDIQEVGCGCMDWIGLAQDRDRWRTLLSAIMNLRFP